MKFYGVFTWPFFFKCFIPSKAFYAITIWPFIILRADKYRSQRGLINHEKIHLRQQLEMLLLPFYIWYGVEYLIRWIATGHRFLAYRTISFEREAYNHEYEYNYLKKRKPYSWFKYIPPHKKSGNK